MGGGSDPPPAFANPQQTADTQQGFNLTAAEAGQAASNVNQSNIYGNLNYQQTGTGPGGIPLYSATQTLSPQMQAIVSSLQGGITGQLGNSGYADGNGADVIGDSTKGLTKTAMDQQVAYLQPFFTQQQEQLDNQLRNQGIGPESPAYSRAMNNLSQSQNQSVTGFLSQIEPQMFNQSMSQYMLPLGVSTGLYNMMDPSFFSKGLVNPPQASVQPANYAGAVASYDQYQMDAYKAQMQQQSDMITGLMKVPSAVLGGWAASPAGGAALTAGMAMV